MESKIRHAYDASYVLKALNSSAVTATETSSKVDLNLITGSVRGALNGKYSERQIDVVLHVTALDHTTGDETYSVAFTTWDAAGANAVTHQTRALTTADVGKTLVFSFKTGELAEERGDSVGALFGFVNTLAGTTPSVTYWSFAAPNPDAV
jgi:hypothetical protein